MVSMLFAVALAAAPTPAEKAAAKLVTAEALTGHARFLASDELEGRAPASAGDRLAQRYVAAQLESFGLAPGVPDGGWLQPVELVGVTGTPKVISVAGPAQKLELAQRTDFIAVAGHQRATAALDKAELVFAGYGIVAPEFQWDDFKGRDLQGKVLVVLNNDPEDDPALFAGKARLRYGRWDYKYEQAAKRGAAGCLIIHTTPSAGYPWQVVQTSWSGEQFSLPDGEGPKLEVKGWLTEDAAARVVALGGRKLDELRAAAQRRDFEPLPLGLTASAAFNNAVARRTTANVLGLLRGSDPKLAREVVVVTAHHDHLGRKPGVAPGEDDIYNGAVDNAAGVAALLAAARAMASLPKAPRRSVLFASLAAEEQGLLGSQYLVEHPPVPLALLVANVNIDGMNVWGRTHDVSVIGLGKSTVDRHIVELARAQGRVVRPDALADRGFFYRSDQYNFAKRGVPSAYFASGHDFVGRPEGWGREQREKWEATHYHQPSDELTAEWDLSGAVEDTQLYLQLALALANAPRAPAWTKGDEFEAAR